MKRWGKRILIALLSLVVLMAGGFYIYTLDYYRADADVAMVFSQDGVVVQAEGYLTTILPDQPNGDGFIFYPGGKVEETAYLPLLRKLADRGISCVLVKMPVRLAVLGVNRADAVFNTLPDVKRWYIGGHSLGGAMASSYAGNHSDKLAGLILLAAYPVNDATLPTIAIFGSEDGVLNRDKLAAVDNVVEIVGGNHAWFGNYGAQAGDGVATITHDEQQDECVETILQFLDTTAGPVNKG